MSMERNLLPINTRVNRSQSVEQGGLARGPAGAEIRHRLLGLTVERFGVAAGLLKVHEGVVVAPDARQAKHPTLLMEQAIAA